MAAAKRPRWLSKAAGTAGTTGSAKKTLAKPATRAGKAPSKGEGPAVAPVQARSPRRGIRLKSDDEPGGDKS